MIERDDVTIHLPAFGGVLTQFIRAEFVEFRTCVVGHAITTKRQVPPDMAVPLVGISANVTGTIDSPLGARVLLNRSGQPIAVHPAVSEAI